MTPRRNHIAIEELLGPLNDVERKNAPSQLFFAGHLDLMEAGPRVSIIGSRKTSGPRPHHDPRLRAARGLAAGLVRKGAVVVSGLADGVDAAAHKGAIDARGKTMAVIGTPLDKV